MQDMRKGLVLTSALRLLVLIGLAVLAGCDDRDGSSSRLPFSHKNHVEDQELKCQACHAAKGDAIGMPAVPTCMKCHEGLDAKKTPEHRLQTYLVNGQLPAPRRVSKLPSDVKFSHQTHAAARVQCATCHDEIEHSKSISSKARVSMKDCQECHSKVKTSSGEKNGCALCHRTINRDWEPASHHADWKQLHGKAIGFMRKDSSQRCETCHTQAWCVKCHREEPPRNHTNYWRDRGHNIGAELDRRSCRTCHTEDFCVRCHRFAAPIPPALRGSYHRGLVGTTGGVGANSCVGCHFEGARGPAHRNPGTTDCLKCHSGSMRRQR
jgi:hypothetical protein